MLHDFLESNSAELIERCRAKVTLRSAPRLTPIEMEDAIPLFLVQLIETLRIGQGANPRPEPASGPEEALPSAMRAGAAKHGNEAREHGYTVDQLVHGYGDLCQAITELAIQDEKAVSSADFKTLNACLDNAIANAVTEFTRTRDRASKVETRAMNERLGFLAHELRNLLNTAVLSFAAIKGGSVAVNGATSAVLDRSLVGLRDLIDHALADVRLDAGLAPRMEAVAMHQFVAEVQVAASLEARAKRCSFAVAPVQRGLWVRADSQMLSSSVSNLLQNAFKFTRAHTHVTLRAYGHGDRVRVEVEDQCGGLPAGKAEALFQPFAQRDPDRSGLGLGLSIARRAVEACSGTLGVRDMPGLGCVFTIDLPRHRPPEAA